MRENKYIEKIKTFDEELLKDYPDQGDLVRLSLSPSFAGSMAQQPHHVLIACAGALARFVCHIQFFGNQYQAQVTHIKRNLESLKARTIGGMKFKERDTDKVRIAAAYAKEPELLQMEKDLSLFEQKAKHYEGMSEAFTGLINVIKYEIRRKEQESAPGRFNAPV